MLLTWLMLAVALCLSAVAAFYSIVGLTAIFAAAVIPIVIMGSILEVAKLVVTVWLHEYWHRCRLTMKAYLVPAVGVLMLITSMGIFGFLSKAHLEQTTPTGDIAAQVSLLDEKIKTERDNIEAARRALQQMDEQVNARLSRSDDDKGAERAVQIRRQQARERSQLQADIAQAQKNIAQINEQRAPIASQLRKVEAEVGPIKYIAALIYGDQLDNNLLERAVRWVIIILVAVFDPLAVMMLLASTESYKWEREQRTPRPEPKPEPVSLPERKPEPDPEPEHKPPSDPEIDHADDDPNNEDDPHIKEAMRLWKSLNPDKTLKGERKKFDQGLIPRLPWMDLLDQLPRRPGHGFGMQFPNDPAKGDIWVRTDSMPTLAYKYNGEAWIPVDKDTTDSYAYDDAYIDHLITQLESGNYDPELLSEQEAEQIEQRIKLRQATK